MNKSMKEELIEDNSCPHSVTIDLCETLRTRQLLIDFDGNRPILSLRAPLDLVNFPSVSRPRWPAECEVISDIIHHIGNVKYYFRPLHYHIRYRYAQRVLSKKKERKHTVKTQFKMLLCFRVGTSRARAFLPAHRIWENTYACWRGEGKSGILHWPW